MDYFNFFAEYQGILSYSKKNEEIIIDLNELLLNYSNNKEILLSNAKRSLSSLLIQLNKPTSSSYSINFPSSIENSVISPLVKIVNTFLTNETNQNKKLSEIFKKISEFIPHISNLNNLILSEFKNLIDDIYEMKKKYEQSKENYITSGKQITSLEELISNNTNNIYKNKAINLDDLNNELTNKKKEYNKHLNEYQNMFDKTNSLFTSSNKKYSLILLKMNESEEKKEVFFTKIFKEYSDYIKKCLDNIADYSSNLLIKIPEIDIEKNKKKFSEILNKFYINENIRIKNEEFIDYDKYKSQLNAVMNKNKMYQKENKRNSKYNITYQDLLFTNSTVNQNDNKNEFIFNENENMIIEQIFLPEDIDDFKFEQLSSKIKNDRYYAKDFIDKILDRYTSSLGVQIFNENNFYKFSKILNNIALNSWIQKYLFEINFALIHISEKTFYQDEKNPFYKIYLCKILSDINPIFKTKNFWQELIMSKIKITIDNKVKELVKIQFEKEKEEEEQKKNEEAQKKKPRKNSANYGKTLFKLAGSVMNNMNNMIYGDQQKEKDEKRKNEIYNEIYVTESKIIALECIRNFTTHFSVFCINSLDVVDIMYEIINIYKIEGEEKTIKYLIAMINSNMYSIKSPRFFKETYKIDKNNEKKNYYIDKFMNKCYIKGMITKTNKNSLLVNILKYLPFSEYIKILCLNKSAYNFIKKKIYKNLLINVDEELPEEITKKNNIPNVWKQPALRLKIWKLLLNFKEINYENLLNELSEKKLDIVEVIKMDVNRMWFEDGDTNKIRISLINVLSAMALLHPKINYSQGMNYIAWFLFDLCKKDEKETFQIFNGLLTSTDYGDLFFNQLSRLNKYFYVFERLIYIYLPEISIHLKNINLPVTFFVSPWFITLFTKAYQNNKDKQNPKVLIWIFDSFILNGWKAIIKIGLCLMKNYESKILSCDLEELMHLLINDILKYEFFQSSNYDNLRNIYDNLKIKNVLIDNIENEYDIKQQNKQEKEKQEKEKQEQKEKQEIENKEEKKET